MNFICLICKKSFFSYNKKRKTCSKKCSAINQQSRIIRQCDFCKKNISRVPNELKYKNIFCDKVCQHKWQRQHKMRFFQLRNKKWCMEKYKEKSLKQIAEEIGCGETIIYKYFKIHGIKLNREQWISGDKHYLWKNGITPFYKMIRNRRKYFHWRQEVLKNNLLQCISCGSIKNLEVDHIKKLKFILVDNTIKTIDDAMRCEELWDIKNGRILCRSCNLLREKKYI